MRKALITGVTGQDGSYLAELLLSKGYAVVGLLPTGRTADFHNIEHIVADIELVHCDLLDLDALFEVIVDADPDEVYNLAAQSSVPASWKQPKITGQATALSVTLLLEASHRASPEIRMFQASSSEVFGNPCESPQTELTPFQPRSPYGTAKAYGHWITANYRERYDMHASAGILFNHESPRRGVDFVTRKISDGAVRIKRGLADELRLGNLEARRDWGFVGDFVRAMWLMLQQDEASDYVIATGETHSVREFCELAFGHLGLRYEDYVVIDERFFRPIEDDVLVGNASKAARRLDWRPRTSFENLVAMMVDADMDRLAAK